MVARHDLFEPRAGARRPPRGRVELRLMTATASRFFQRLSAPHVNIEGASRGSYRIDFTNDCLLNQKTVADYRHGRIFMSRTDQAEDSGMKISVRVLAFAAVATLTATASPTAQSLAEIAKKAAAEREKNAKDGKAAPPKSYSNKDLGTGTGAPAVATVPPDAPTPTAVVATAPKGAIDAKKFEGVYRAAKSIQGATSVGVNYLRFRALVQDLSAEISIVKDRSPFSDREGALLALFEAALIHYDNSAIFWKLKIDMAALKWNGEIPIEFDKLGHPPDTALTQLALLYGIPVHNRLSAPRLLAAATRYKAVPANATQYVWSKAGAAVEAAAALYSAR